MLRQSLTIALVGERDLSRETQRATVEALEHSSAEAGITHPADWISTCDLSERIREEYQGIGIVPGCIFKDQRRLFRITNLARTHAVPCLGMCGGFQQMILEYARNELWIDEAQSEEYQPDAGSPVIARLHCSLRGQAMNLRFSPGSLIEQIYGSSEATESYHCSFGINPTFKAQLASGKMRMTGHDAKGGERVVEWPEHPFLSGRYTFPKCVRLGRNLTRLSRAS